MDDNEWYPSSDDDIPSEDYEIDAPSEEELALLEQFSNWCSVCSDITEELLQQAMKILQGFHTTVALEEGKNIFRRFKAKYDAQLKYCPDCRKSVLQKSWIPHTRSETHKANVWRVDNLRRIDEMIQEADTIEEEDLDDGMIESDSADEFDQTIATHDVLEEPANAMIVISPTISTGAKFGDPSSRLLARFFEEHRGRPLSEDMMASLLRFINHPETSKVVAPTIYHLRKAGQEFAPHCSPEKLELETGSIYHIPIEKILSLVLSHPNTTKLWNYEPDMGQCTTFYRSLLPVGKKLLLVSIFLDEFRKSLNSGTLLDAVVMRIDNLPDIHFVLALLEPYVDKYEFIEKALLPSFQALESGNFRSYFYPTGSQELFFGGLNMVLGDHMGQIHLECIAGPTSKSFIDRYLLIKSCDIWKTQTEEQIQALQRDPKSSLLNVRKAAVEFRRGTQRAAQTYLDQVGLTGISPFWSLKLFRQHFFNRFGMCRLHLILLGHVKFVLSRFGIKLGWKWCQTFNEFIKSTKKSHPSLQLPSKLFFLSQQKDRRRLSRISLLSLNGGEFLAIMKILSEMTILTTLPPVDQELVVALSNLVFATLDIECIQTSLFPIISKYKQHLISSFSQASPKEVEYLCREFNGFNLNFPNNAALWSIPVQHRFCSLNKTDTSLFERGHGDLRKATGSTNGKAHTRDVLAIIMNRISSRYFQTFTSEEEKMKHEAIYGQIVGTNISATEEPMEQPTIHFQFEGENVKGIKLNGKWARKGDLVQVRSQADFWNNPVVLLQEMKLQNDRLWVYGQLGTLTKLSSNHAKISFYDPQEIHISTDKLQRVLDRVYEFQGQHFINTHMNQDLRVDSLWNRL